MKFLVPPLYYLSFLLHLVKRSGNFHSDVIGNRELFQWQQILVLQFCIPVAVERERERERGEMEKRRINGWKSIKCSQSAYCSRY